MSDRLVVDRLWPVLVALLALVVGAVVLERYAEEQAGEPLTIRVEGGLETTDTFDDRVAAPNSPALDDARVQARRGDFEPVRRVLGDLTRSHPDDPRYLAELGFWSLAARDPSAAEGWLQRAHALVPAEPWVAHNLGVARLRLDDPEGAEAAFRAALDARSAYTPARLALANLLRERQEFTEALAVIEPATQHGGNLERAKALATRGRLLMAAGQGVEAAASFEGAIERAPGSVEVRVLVARAYADAETPEQLARGLELVRAVVDLAPDQADGYVLLGRLLERVEEPVAAADAYRQALSRAPDQRLARRRLLRLELERRDFAAARLHVQRLLADGPDDPEHHFLNGLVAAREGRRDDARVAYRTAIDKAGGTYPEAFFNLGVVERADGAYDAAVAAYRAAIAQRQTYTAARSNLGLVLVAAERFEEAEATYRQALDLDPRYAPAWLNLGRLYLKLKRFDDAVDAFERALDVRPDYQEAQLNVAVALSRSGRREAAIAAYRAILVAHPRYVTAWYNLGVALEDTGNIAEARTAYERALAVDPGHAGSIRKLSSLEAAAGQGALARRMLEDLLDITPGDTQARLALAEVWWAQGDGDACRREVGRVLRTDPSDARAKRLAQVCGREPAGGE